MPRPPLFLPRVSGAHARSCSPVHLSFGFDLDKLATHALGDPLLEDDYPCAHPWLLQVLSGTLPPSKGKNHLYSRHLLDPTGLPRFKPKELQSALHQLLPSFRASLDLSLHSLARQLACGISEMDDNRQRLAHPTPFKMHIITWLMGKSEWSDDVQGAAEALALRHPDIAPEVGEKYFDLSSS